GRRARLRRVVLLRLQPAPGHARGGSSRRHSAGGEARTAAAAAGGHRRARTRDRRIDGGRRAARAGRRRRAPRRRRARRAHVEQPGGQFPRLARAHRRLRRRAHHGSTHAFVARRAGRHCMTRARTRVASLALAVLVSPPAPALAQSTAPPPSNAAGAAGERVGSDAQAAPIPRSGTAPAESPRTLAQLLRSARAWIEAGEADRAWRALEDRLDDYAGDPGFDYLLGLAALDSGRPGRAVLALERVLIVRPDFLQARAELARAYFRLREHENARREFETVAARPIPEERRRVIGRYRDAIRRLERAGEPEFVAWAELDAGYDSNANFGSASGHWVLADGTEVVPLGISRPRESAAFGAAIGADWTVPIGGHWQWTVGGRAATRRYPSAHTLDQDQFDLNTGFTHRSGCHRIDMLVQAQHLELGGAGFRDAVGALVQWQCD